MRPYLEYKPSLIEFSFLLSHESKQTSLLPPKQLWNNLDLHNLPYGWEIAFDAENKPYYIK